MVTKSIAWNTGSGNITVDYNGSGDGTIQISSDPNNLYENRSAQITIKTTDGSNITRTLTIQQAAKVRIDISTATVTAATQTYSGSAKTPTPTVTLNGETIPSSGYDVAYSNNTNAGTATITVTGKGDYTGTATGSFTIAKANPTYTAPTARTGLTYSGSSQYLVTAGSTSHGTIQYSSNGTTWSTTRPNSTNAGSYTTYWRLVGDSNHNDVASTSLSTTIAKASRTLSFADSYVVLNTSSNVTKTATPSAGSGDGTITYSISSTTYATINSSSGKITSKTSDGSAVVTATISEGTNYLSASASYNLYVFATIHNFSYTSSVQSVTLPPGSYQLQCWGAQGGSNAAASSYDITAQAGGKGGYSEGVLTVSSSRTVYVFVGGQGSSSGNGGWNGGGGSSGSSSYSSGDTFGTSRLGCGGGATDIALTTSSMSYSSYRNNRSSSSLLSRMIVAGGGSGGAMGAKVVTSTQTKTESIAKSSINSIPYVAATASTFYYINSANYVGGYISVSKYRGGTCTISSSSASMFVFLKSLPTGTGSSIPMDFASGESGSNSIFYGGTSTKTVPSDANYLFVDNITNGQDLRPSLSFTYTETSTSTTNSSQVGYVGGGTTGGGYSSTYTGKQDSAGNGGGFGYGCCNDNPSYRFSSGNGGGGWYGGGSACDNNTLSSIRGSGGGSGFVNTSASASYRPSGYTGLQLDSGETKDGNTSFPNTAGTGNETGHSGNGYAKITRLS